MQGTLIEQKEAPQFPPNRERCNARTMEIYRRMGLAGRIRAVGLGRSVPMDVHIVLAMNERPLLRLPSPSVAQAADEIRSTNDGTLQLGPYRRISQDSTRHWTLHSVADRDEDMKTMFEKTVPVEYEMLPCNRGARTCC